MKQNQKMRLLATSLLFLDQLTKYIFFNHERLSSRPMFYPAFNTGVSRSVQIPIVIVILIAGLAIGAFIVAYQRKYFTRLVFALLLAGTLGNLIDRTLFNGVRDFLYVGGWFPIFNFADIYLNIGVLLFILPEFFAGKGKAKS